MYATNRLTYFSNEVLDPDPLLHSLRIMQEFHPKKKGFYLEVERYGRWQSKRLMSIENIDQGSEGSDLLLYKPCTEGERVLLQRWLIMNPELEIYILAHKLYDFSEWVDHLVSLGVSPQRLRLLTQTDSPRHHVHYEMDLKACRHKHLPRLNVALQKKTVSVSPSTKTGWAVPFFLIGLVRFLLSPWAEIKKTWRVAQVFQLRGVIRVKELFSFLFYLIGTFRFFYHGVRQAYGASRRVVIPGFFKARHRFLMVHFKSYGWLVDLYFSVDRVVRIQGPRIYFKTRARLIQFKDGVQLILIRLGFRLRHLLLMGYFKLYGFVYDMATFLFFAIRRPAVRFFLAIRWEIYRPLRHHFLMGFFKIYGFLSDLLIPAFYFCIRQLRKIYALMRHAFLMTFFKIYGLCFDAGLGAFVILKTIFIRVYFPTRHVILMGIFKVYGVLYDTVAKSYAVVGHFGRLIFYPIRHWTLMAFFKTYGLCFILVVKTFAGLKWIAIKTYFPVRHILLMTLFKTYGLFYDIAAACWRPLRHYGLMGSFKIFGWLVDAGVSVWYPLKHFSLLSAFRIYGWIYDAGVALWYPLKHFSLLSAFRIYGWIYDAGVALWYPLKHFSLLSAFRIYGWVYDAGVAVWYPLKHFSLAAFFPVYGWFYDLAVALWYPMKHITLLVSYKVYGFSYDVIVFFYYFGRFTATRFFLSTRHILLMTAFKSYGFFYDLAVFLFYFIVSRGRWIYFVSRHGVKMSFWKIYGAFYDIGVRLYYFYLHQGRRLFGVGVDFYFYLRFFLTRILPYPLFKAYWFFEFQYRKRIKNRLWTE